MGWWVDVLQRCLPVFQPYPSVPNRPNHPNHPNRPNHLIRLKPINTDPHHAQQAAEAMAAAAAAIAGGAGGGGPPGARGANRHRVPRRYLRLMSTSVYSVKDAAATRGAGPAGGAATDPYFHLRGETADGDGAAPAAAGVIGGEVGVTLVKRASQVRRWMYRTPRYCAVRYGGGCGFGTCGSERGPDEENTRARVERSVAGRCSNFTRCPGVMYCSSCGRVVCFLPGYGNCRESHLCS